MKITVLPLSQLKRPERNVRVHPDKQVKELIRSIEMFGQTRPMVVDENYTVLAGNGLLTALEQMGKTEAECYVMPNLSANQKKKLMLADNRIYKLGVDDMEAFDAIVAELGTDIDVPGFDEELLKVLNADLESTDDLFSGYGIVSNEQKEKFEQASAGYQRDETEFTKEFEQITPNASGNELQQPSNALSSDTQSGISPAAQAAESALESFAAPTPLQRRFIVCPKCGEKIWM